jgi:hypothetical protein
MLIRFGEYSLRLLPHFLEGGETMLCLGRQSIGKNGFEGGHRHVISTLLYK